jgi:hypothetical protein
MRLVDGENVVYVDSKLENLLGHVFANVLPETRDRLTEALQAAMIDGKLPERKGNDDPMLAAALQTARGLSQTLQARSGL